MDIDWLVRRAPLDLAGRVFETGIIVLNGQGLDVILEMSLDEMAQGHIGHIYSASPPELTRVWKGHLQLPAVSHIKASLHHAVELKLEDIHVVRVFGSVSRCSTKNAT
jgi:hypothetical protein